MPVPSSDFDKNEHYASFATTSRLVACLTSESLLPVYYVPAAVEAENFIGLCLLLRPVKNKEDEIINQVTLDSILAVIPLRGLPILDTTITANWNGIVCTRIDLVDNLDMQPHIYSIGAGASDKHSSGNDYIKQTLASILSSSSTLQQQLNEFHLQDGYDAVHMWDRFAGDLAVNGKLREQIGQELGSSINFQSKFQKIS